MIAFVTCFFASLVTSVVTTAAPAQAADGNILPPFDIGQNWNICQGYSNPNVTHTGTSTYGIDLTGAGCDNSASGRNVRAPMDGTVAYYQASYGNLCINVSGGRSLTLTHINSSVTIGTVSAGQLVGTVAAPGQRANNGVAHIHFQMWSSPNCYSSSGIPFDSANGARICGAPNLTAAGPNGGNGTWSGTSFTGANCGEPPNNPIQWHLRNVNTDGGANVAFSYGTTASDHPVTGEWDGDGTFTAGIVRNSGSVWQWHLKNYHGVGPASVSFSYGAVATDMPVTGDWDGDGTFTPGITRAG